MLTTRSRFRVLSEIAQQNDSITETEEKKEKRRRKVTKELFETEKTYLNHLELVNKHFDFPLRFNCFVPDNVHSKIFSNIEQISEVNKTLLEYMEQTTVGQAFHYLGPFLKLYSSYANNHENALATLQEWVQKSTELKAFIQTQEDRPEIQGLKLNALLITPVQRIPRYKLLLEDLLECTSEDHHDYHQLKESAHQIAEIASHINEHMKQHANFQKMLSIQKSFDSSAPKVLAPGREFLREGVLKKVSKKGGKSHDRMFFLFSDMLIYGKPKFLDSGHNTYSCCCVLPLKHCQVERVFGKNGNNSMTDTGGMFTITCKDESLLLLSHDPHNVQQWMDTLEAAIKKLCSNRSTLRKPSSNKLPMRGKSLWKQMKQEKTEDKMIRAKLQPVGEEKSPCLPDGLSPFKKNLPDFTRCMSPSKKRKLENEANSTPHPPVRQRKRGVASISDSAYTNSPVHQRKGGVASISDSAYTNSPVHQRKGGVASISDSAYTNSPVHQRKRGVASISDSAYTNSPVHQRKGGVASISDSAYTNSPVKRCTRQRRSESEYSETSEVFNDTNEWNATPSQSADFTENTFMQVTMDDLDLAEITQNSFCQPRKEENTSSTNVYYPKSYHRKNTQSCVRQPFTRLLNHGRGFTKRCQSAVNNVQTRISETKQNCSIQ